MNKNKNSIYPSIFSRRNIISWISLLLVMAILVSYFNLSNAAPGDPGETTTEFEYDKTGGIISYAPPHVPAPITDGVSDGLSGPQMAPMAAPSNAITLTSGGTYDISVGPVIIPAGSENYTIKGSYESKVAGEHVIIVKSGYTGTITFDNVKIDTVENAAPMILEYGGGTNDNPTTKMTLLLKGDNELFATTKIGKRNTSPENSSLSSEKANYAAIDVMVGTQITIDSATSPGSTADTLWAEVCHNKVSGTYGNSAAAGIGAGHTGDGRTASQLGGNVVIKGGAITAYGGDHGAGIGGSWASGNSASVIIVGGNITSVGGVHAHGIGQGCQPCKGSLLVIPPAVINQASGGYGTVGGTTV
ncbi:MAG: hypothetical protein LBC56_00950, partial [Oscillospiraceae bacterium]|nr:hypothetical protein [Oscillospiraceae bacterium]